MFVLNLLVYTHVYLFCSMHIKMGLYFALYIKSETVMIIIIKKKKTDNVASNLYTNFPKYSVIQVIRM